MSKGLVVTTVNTANTKCTHSSWIKTQAEAVNDYQHMLNLRLNVVKNSALLCEVMNGNLALCHLSSTMSDMLEWSAVNESAFKQVRTNQETNSYGGVWLNKSKNQTEIHSARKHPPWWCFSEK